MVILNLCHNDFVTEKNNPVGKITEPLNVIIVIDDQNKVDKTFMKIFWHVL